MNEPTSSPIAKAIERVLEFSADAQIKRRDAAVDSPAFQKLTGEIAAYGRMLRVLSKLQQLEEEQYQVIGQFDLLETTASRARPL